MSTVVTIGKAKSKDYMQFEFADDFGAWVFYSQAKDHYREDDLVITMWDEKGEEDGHSEQER